MFDAAPREAGTTDELRDVTVDMAASDVISQRVTEGLEELKQQAQKP